MACLGCEGKMSTDYAGLGCGFSESVDSFDELLMFVAWIVLQFDF